MPTTIYSGSCVPIKTGRKLMPQIAVSDDTMNRLKASAEPFVDKCPEDVIRRLFDERGSAEHKQAPSQLLHQSERRVVSRVPRERGTDVQIGSYRIQAV